MGEAFGIETPLLEIIIRGTVVYLAVGLVMRLVPKRQTGDVSPNDMIALVIIGSLGADAVMGEARTAPDIFLMILVIVFWDYMYNVVEYRFPKFRKIAQDTPTLLIHNGNIIQKNLRREKLTKEELAANLRKQGITNPASVRFALLEADGQISIVEREQES